MQLSTKRHQSLIYEIWNAVTHGIGFLGSLILVIMLLTKSSQKALSSVAVISLAVYGGTLLLLYLASTLFHCLAFTPAKRVFQILDHSNIFLLIAGTYTPYCLIFIGHTAGISLLIAIWILAIAGIVTHILSHGRYQKLETTIYVVMGWLCLFTGKTLYVRLTPLGFWLLVSGGVVFTIGALIYSFPKIPGLHLIWHFLVMLGTTLMFFSIYLNI
ncbi:PAQR family membrane homeostasis protein TrhA [Latilactobacillus graminis]|uniref:Hemolysin III n=2 Tax=Latilactobacillus graminis TaxID=60519 RepID=A0AA89I084_9LACO|nr:hemolysin III family protein [Latilactobacillus graminis]KRM21940.1 hypothetical protein FC90_GL001092 [Latilactobacillus graminis DSM 20719]QFP79628.1 hemolysin III family protein [Latilactobacillus graminis]